MALNEFDALGTPPKVIVEVGAYDGDEALSLKQRYPNARVITFEADPKNYADTTTLLAGSGIEVVQAAVCDHNNGVDFWPQKSVVEIKPGWDTHGNRVCGSILQPTVKTARHTFVSDFADAPIRVPSTRLDEFCRTAGIAAIDIIQIDVQGAEIFVLKGLGDLRPKVIFLEVN